MTTIKLSAKTFGTASTVNNLTLSTMQVTVDDLIQVVRDMDTLLTSFLSIFNIPKNYSSIVFKVIYGLIIFFSCFSLIGLILLAFFNMIKFRHLMYFSFIVISIITLFTLIIAFLCAIIFPLFTWVCYFLNYSL